MTKDEMLNSTSQMNTILSLIQDAMNNGHKEYRWEGSIDSSTITELVANGFIVQSAGNSLRDGSPLTDIFFSKEL